MIGLLLAILSGGTTRDSARAAAAAPAGDIQIPELSLVSSITRSNFKVSATSTTGGGGAGAGDSTFEPLVVQRPVDQNSPALMRAVATGVHFDDVVVRVFRPGTTRPHVTYELGDVVLTLVEQNARAERIALAYRTIEMRSGEATACYDIVAHSTC